MQAARSTPGVLAVFSYGDMQELNKPSFGSGSYRSLAPLHDRRIWHDGQIMALVVAESLQVAEEGAACVTVEYVAQPPSAELDSPGTEELAPAGKVAMLDKDPALGDLAVGLAGAEARIDAEYRTPTQTHNPIELFATTAAWSGGHLTVYEPSQSVYGFRAELALEDLLASAPVA